MLEDSLVLPENLNQLTVYRIHLSKLFEEAFMESVIGFRCRKKKYTTITNEEFPEKNS